MQEPFLVVCFSSTGAVCSHVARDFLSTCCACCVCFVESFVGSCVVGLEGLIMVGFDIINLMFYTQYKMCGVIHRQTCTFPAVWFCVCIHVQVFLMHLSIDLLWIIDCCNLTRLGLPSITLVMERDPEWRPAGSS